VKNAIIQFFLKSWTIPLFIALTCFIYSYSQKGWNNSYINGDGKGYYAYLPAIFIYKDLHFKFIEKYEKEHYQPEQLCDFRQPVEGGIVNRYYVGTALTQLPFFIFTHFTCKFLNNNDDGYSKPYQYTILFAACFYLFIGLWALHSFLIEFFSEKHSIFIIVCITFSTPLLFYTVFNPDFSHIYSFAFISLFVKYTSLYFNKPQNKIIILLFLLLGIITLIRPVNLIIIFILPFLAGSWKNFSEKIPLVFQRPTFLLYGVALFILIVFIQLYIYYLQTDNFIVYSYGEAGFNFHDPNFLNFLFSYRKGMFIYTPLLFISLGGFIYLAKENIFKCFSLFLFLILMIYVLSSWSVWSYGMTYGQRPVIEFYFIFALLLGYLLKIFKTSINIIVVCMIFLSIPHNLIQIVQHRHYILHWDDMNKEKFWKVFLRTDPIYYGYLWTPLIPILDDTSGYHSLYKDRRRVLKPLQEIKPIIFQADSTSDSLNIILSLKIYPEGKTLKKNRLHLMVRRKMNYEIDGYDFDVNMRNLEPNKWNNVNKQVKLLKHSKQEEFVLYVYNKGKYSFHLGKLEILMKRK